MNPARLSRFVTASLLLALIVVGAYISADISQFSVPITLSSLFVILAALFLPPVWTAGVIALYLILGAVGLPVFAGGATGIEVLFGPIGGRFAGYLPGAVAASLLSGQTLRRGDPKRYQGPPTEPRRDHGWKRDALAGAAFILIGWSTAVTWFAYFTGTAPWSTEATELILPLGADVAKVVGAILVARQFRPHPEVEHSRVDQDEETDKGQNDDTLASPTGASTPAPSGSPESA